MATIKQLRDQLAQVIETMDDVLADGLALGAIDIKGVVSTLRANHASSNLVMGITIDGEHNTEFVDWKILADGVVYVSSTLEGVFRQYIYAKHPGDDLSIVEKLIDQAKP